MEPENHLEKTIQKIEKQKTKQHVNRQPVNQKRINVQNRFLTLCGVIENYSSSSLTSEFSKLESQRPNTIRILKTKKHSNTSFYYFYYNQQN